MTNGTERPCGSCRVVEGPHRSDCYWYNPSYESGRKTHDLKVNPQFWDDLVAGLKPFELRRNDRAFKAGDALLLRRYDHSTGYTGQSIERQISYILYPEDCPGLERGFVILGLDNSHLVDATLEQAARICDEITSWGLSPTKLEVAESTQRFCAKAIRAQKSDSEERKRHEAKAAGDADAN